VKKLVNINWSGHLANGVPAKADFIQPRHDGGIAASGVWSPPKTPWYDGKVSALLIES
jgi:hypothetical protein